MGFRLTVAADQIKRDTDHSIMIQHKLRERLRNRAVRWVLDTHQWHGYDVTDAEKNASSVDYLRYS